MPGVRAEQLMDVWFFDERGVLVQGAEAEPLLGHGQVVGACAVHATTSERIRWWTGQGAGQPGANLIGDGGNPGRPGVSAERNRPRAAQSEHAVLGEENVEEAAGPIQSQGG